MLTTNFITLLTCYSDFAKDLLYGKGRRSKAISPTYMIGTLDSLIRNSGGGEVNTELLAECHFNSMFRGSESFVEVWEADFSVGSKPKTLQLVIVA